MMSKAVKIWLIVAASLIILGGLVFTITMAANNWSFLKLGGQYQTTTHTVTEDVHTVSVQVDTADVTFLASEDGRCRVECYEKSNESHAVTVTDGTLTIQTNPQKWYQHIGINWRTPRITVYLPEATPMTLDIETDTGDISLPSNLTFESIDIETDTGDVVALSPTAKRIHVETDTGDIRVQNITAEALNLSVETGQVTVTSVTTGDVSVEVSTGDTRLTDLACKNLFSTGDTGYLHMKNVTASEQMSLNRSTGDITFDMCDAGEITVKTDTGSVTGTLLSEKVFIPRSSTGHISCPETLTGGKCKVTTSTGNIKFQIAN